MPDVSKHPASDGVPALPGEVVIKLSRTCKECGGDWTTVSAALKKGLAERVIRCPYCGRTVALPTDLIVPEGQADRVILSFGEDQPRKKHILPETFAPDPIPAHPLLKRANESDITQFVRFSNRVTVVIGVMIVLAVLILVIALLAH